MRKLFFVTGLIVLSLIVEGRNYLTTTEGFEITIQFKGLTEGEMATLTLLFIDEHDNDNGVMVDSAIVKLGQCHFKGTVPEGPRAYLIKIHHRFLPIHFNNNEKIVITSLYDQDINDFHHGWLENWVKIDGSITANAAKMLMRPTICYKQNIGQINTYLKKLKDSVGFDPVVVGAMVKAKAIHDFSFYQTYLRNVDNDVSPARLQFLDALNSTDCGQHSFYLMEIYKNTSQKEKNSYYGSLLKRWATLAIGQTFPDFSLPNTEGRIISLKDVVAKGRMTVIHFWATNSTESRDGNERLLATLYKKYHDKGLNIVGISADTEDYMWKGYLKKRPDQNAWYQVSDLKGNQTGSIIKDRYLEGGHRVPNTTNVLLNSKGEIVAWLDADHAQYTMELQYYIWRAFE